MAMKQTGSGHRALPSAVYAVGLVSVYLGERVLEVGSPSVVMTVLGLALVFGSFGWRIFLAQTAPPQRRPAEQWLALLSALGMLALALYFLNSNLTFQLTGHTFEQRWPRLSGIVGALWPALLVTGTLPMLFGELSLATMTRAPVVDLGRVRAAMMSALGTAFAVVFCFAIAYVASERDVKKDFSYFRTARAGEATVKLVRALDKPVHIYLFFPPANEVREEVTSYFDDLTHESKQLVVEQYDHALHPAKARELGVSGNGVIVIGREGLREQISVPLQLDQARTVLKNLDQDVHKRIIGVTRPNRVVYFTQGHEERGFEPTNETDQRPTVRMLKELLLDQNYQPKELSMAQGLGSDVPADAGVVMIIGPRKPFFKEEIDALLRYLDRKGRLFIALDPESGDVCKDLLAAVSLKFNPVTLANDQFYINRTYQHADRVNIATGSYSSHSSVSTLSHLGMRLPLVLFGAGYLQKAEKGAPGIVNVDFTVHAHPATWNDLNGNFEFDSDKEARQAYELAAAVSKRNASAIAVEDEARVFVLADSDAVADLLMERAPGNKYLVRDSVRWLAGEEQLSGAINTEEDQPITHTRHQDTVWFYSSVFVVPAMVLGLGAAMNRRRRSGKKAPASPGASPPPSPPTSEATT